ncbi:hypothetical protein DPMN_076088 [Dreissena polymorpha]|uniref:Uncharacterized protein n=1 Tax=Dreissena polymorpha TaxID=45954 RepID=A0A9D4BM40_DREPO|nr:hypothetical protein DPMN_076088 [Dreissena polymorpha]
MPSLPAKETTSENIDFNEASRVQKEALGGIRVLSESQMWTHLSASAREKLIRGESQVEKKNVPNADSYKYALRKFNKPLRSHSTYEITDASRASVKYGADIKKNTALLLGDLKGTQSTVIPNTNKSDRSQVGAHSRHSSGVSEEVISK